MNSKKTEKSIREFRKDLTEMNYSKDAIDTIVETVIMYSLSSKKEKTASEIVDDLIK